MYCAHIHPLYRFEACLKLNQSLAFISGGKVYRKDDDATHLPMFHQIEGIYIDENVSFANLKDIIYQIINSYLAKISNLDSGLLIFLLQNRLLRLI